MSTISSVSSGLAAISYGTARLDQDAQQIANPNDGLPVAPLVDLSQASLEAEAGAAVVHASDKILGTLLDIFA
jgi:hypothetical protein